MPELVPAQEMLRSNIIQTQKRQARAIPELLMSVSIDQACAWAMRSQNIKKNKEEKEDATAELTKKPRAATLLVCSTFLPDQTASAQALFLEFPDKNNTLHIAGRQ